MIWWLIWCLQNNIDWYIHNFLLLLFWTVHPYSYFWMEVSMWPFHIINILMTKYHFCNHMVFSSKLQEKHRKEFQFMFRVVDHQSLYLHSCLPVWLFHLNLETYWLVSNLNDIFSYYGVHLQPTQFIWKYSTLPIHLSTS